MTHPLVSQLRFARAEFQRGLADLPAADATKRLAPMNCISWMVGHLAVQEHYLWVFYGQGEVILPEHVFARVGYGQPASTPPLDEMWGYWREVTAAADRFLDTVTADLLSTHMTNAQGKQSYEDIGTSLLRNTYHYFFHLGEAYAVRQLLGHADLPEFVGNMAAVQYALDEG